MQKGPTQKHKQSMDHQKAEEDSSITHVKDIYATANN